MQRQRAKGFCKCLVSVFEKVSLETSDSTLSENTCYINLTDKFYYLLDLTRYSNKVAYKGIGTSSHKENKEIIPKRRFTLIPSSI